MDDRQYMAPRFHSPHVKIVAARDNGRLIGSNVATRWGSFGFFGPLTVLPEYWDRGVAQQLLQATMEIFDGWGLRHSGLFTFPQSAKHIGLYQKFGYWPRYLTAVMTRTPEVAPATNARPPLGHEKARARSRDPDLREAHPQDRQRPRPHRRNPGPPEAARRRRGHRLPEPSPSASMDPAPKAARRSVTSSLPPPAMAKPSTSS